MSKQQMKHPEGHSNWVPTPTGGVPHNDGDTNNTTTPHSATLPGAPVHSTASFSGGDTIRHGVPVVAPVGDEEVLMGTPYADPLGDAVTKHRKDMHIYSGAMAIHLALGAALGWLWHLSGAEVSDSVWGYVLRWSCVAWVAGFCVLCSVWLSARRELKRELASHAETYAENAGLSGEDSALFTQTIGEVS